jgi:hypothetical protein
MSAAVYLAPRRPCHLKLLTWGNRGGYPSSRRPSRPDSRQALQRLPLVRSWERAGRHGISMDLPTPAMLYRHQRSTVTGQTPLPDPLTCGEARSDRNRCGQDGRYWESKDPPDEKGFGSSPRAGSSRFSRASTSRSNRAPASLLLLISTVSGIALMALMVLFWAWISRIFQ